MSVTAVDYQKLIAKQKEYFFSDATRDIDFRKAQLKKFYRVLKDNENLLYEAVYKDFKKSSFDTFATELALLYSELEHSEKNVKIWAEKRKVGTNLANVPGSSYIIPEPLGVTLVIGAWNYPYLLSLHPAVSAIAAGNTVIVKPSELSSHSAAAMAKIINENFEESFFHVIEGGVTETTELLKEHFDLIFYTGSGKVGKIIMHAAAEHLTPVILELGGKSPAFILRDADIKMTAKRIAWGKFLNGGQTCVAPDYLLIHKDIKEKFLSSLKTRITEIHGNDPRESEAYPRIINERHFERLINLIQKDKVVFGGEADRSDLYIAPTVMDNISWDDPVMEDEIFGPILPVIAFEELERVIEKVRRLPKPLALYVFGKSGKARDKIFNRISFGGGIANDTIMHLANPNLPFGGVGSSGMGSYHGKFGFDAFSHLKAVMHKTNLIEPFIKYPPYNDTKKKLLGKLI